MRLYQDSMFLKRPNDGATRWHSDLHMAPFDTNAMVTAWIPLDPVPAQDEGGTGLTFASGSHRDFALAFWSRPHEAGADFSARYESAMASHGALGVGDATWHHGWTLHSAPANDPWFGVDEGLDEDDLDEATLAAVAARSRQPRLALTVSFIADGARVQGSRAPFLGLERVAPAATTGAEGGARNCEGAKGKVEEGVCSAGSNGGENEDDEEEKEKEEGEEEKDVAPPLQTVVDMDDEDRSSYEAWLPDISPGGVADHPLLPLVWDESKD